MRELEPSRSVRSIHVLLGSITIRRGATRRAFGDELPLSPSFSRGQALGDDAIESARSSVSSTSRPSVAILLADLVVVPGIDIFVTAWLARTVFRPEGAE
jgi:hypothetical protein